MGRTIARRDADDRPPVPDASEILDAGPGRAGRYHKGAEIVSDGYHGHATLEDGSHVPLTAEMAKALWEAAERSAADRAALMPTSRDAMRVISDAHHRMSELGWRKGGGLRVNRGDKCAVREDTSTGIWSGWVDDDGEYVHYCYGVSKPRKVWLKPLSDLTDDERDQMAECDASERAWHDRMIQSFIAMDQDGTGEPK